jgi:HSP20 family protein
MALMKWEPFGDMDRFFYDIAPMSLSSLARSTSDCAVDLYEEDGNLIARMSIPGMKIEDMAVSVNDQYLSVSGSRVEEKEEKEKQYYHKEIRRGSFERVIHLPKEVDREKIVAEYEQGVLTVTMPEVVKRREDRHEIVIQEKHS